MVHKLFRQAMVGGVKMINRVITFSLIVMLSASHSSYADQVESAADNLYYTPHNKFNQRGKSHSVEMQSCKTDNSALITVYSTNGLANSSIEVKVDGRPIGNLTSYYPDGDPGCQTPSARGIITIMLPAGKHTLEASSTNLNWPSQNFSLEKCKCMLLPLS